MTRPSADRLRARLRLFLRLGLGLVLALTLAVGGRSYRRDAFERGVAIDGQLITQGLGGIHLFIPFDGRRSRSLQP